MFEEDYIMRTIKEMVRAIIRLLTGIDTENATEDLLENEQQREALLQLKNLIDLKKVNEAENELYSMMDSQGKEVLLVALLFYSYLNELDEEYLQDCDYTKEEIKLGLQNVVRRFGVVGFEEMF